MGFAIAFWYYSFTEGRYLQAAGQAHGISLLAWCRDYPEMQRERGGYEQYRDALLDYHQVGELAQRTPLMSDFFDHSDRAMNYTRLSRLESELGTPGEAKRYIDLAVEECAAIEYDWVDCTPETLLDFVEQYEKLRRNIARDRIRRNKEGGGDILIDPKRMWPPMR
ncbi:MAG: hypothetical protein OEU25_14550 [Rhodospirillales bacterium]|nr:hypothetical protein [Rhodospirillales bacterium]